jgi:hypothetical protein
MNFGFNSNVSVGSASYHVQTEDRGPVHPYMDTVIYVGGRIVYKRSTNYKELVDDPHAADQAQRVRELLSQQHREIIAHLEAGKLTFTTERGAPPQPRQVSHSGEKLDVVLLNPKSWLKGRTVTLEVELRRADSVEKAVGASLETYLESDSNRTSAVRTATDTQGLATLRFQMPATVGDGVSLVIRASQGSMQGELRFRLKPRAQEKVPSGSVK